MSRRRATTLQRRALRVVQDPKHPLYLFALTAEELLGLASVSRVGRDEAGDLIGYQRAEVRKHVQSIKDYLDAAKGKALFPNSVILALSSSATFSQARGPKVDDGLAEAGTIRIRMPAEGEAKPAWIVDGQQRAFALSRCKRRDIPVPISAFIADDVATQREQFLRINSTKPLPRGLVSELLPEVDTVLPPNLAARRAPAALCDLLNRDPNSPFHQLIRRSSAKNKKAVVADTVVMSMLQESFSTPSGCLFSYRNIATGETDFDGVRELLYLYWGTVRDVFPDAWGKPPTKSRLMHGAGLRAMGKLMDRVMATIDVRDPRAAARIQRELKMLKPVCAWTAGVWSDLGGLRWNEVQNVPHHVRMLTNLLVRTHVAAARKAS